MLMEIETDGTSSGFPIFAPDEISDVMQIPGYADIGLFCDNVHYKRVGHFLPDATPSNSTNISSTIKDAFYFKRSPDKLGPPSSSKRRK